LPRSMCPGLTFSSEPGAQCATSSPISCHNMERTITGRKGDLFGEYSNTYADGERLEPAHAKVNLVLYVGGRRPDGFHPVATLLQSLSLHDIVRVRWRGLTRGRRGVTSYSPGSVGTLRVTSDDASLPSGEENLAAKAVRALEPVLQRCGVVCDVIDIHIEKRIPVAAGLAGGSTDAAAVLRALNVGLGLGLGEDELHVVAARVGSDVPACVTGGTLYCRGRGEHVTPVKSRPLWWVLANPGGALRAGAVYQALDLHFPHLVRSAGLEAPIDELLPGVEDALVHGDAARVATYCANDLQRPALHLDPRLEPLVTCMREAGALAALVSGSGPTVAGLAADEVSARTVAEALRGDVPWVWWGSSVQPET